MHRNPTRQRGGLSEVEMCARKAGCATFAERKATLSTLRGAASFPTEEAGAVVGRDPGHVDLVPL